ncbi:hypothetical protein [Arundinibacter roseus]|uniref:Uncharacterized protein n=1 Tax=Arundinibacter roseus TaxID=2070510 RepID=A0A4R4KQW1_9BACT|nr:hypothetical protein [Arundinibacter roseus]TDB68771.1 hypothetical protein EZE20_00035 [Arundinibacter roseus]
MKKSLLLLFFWLPGLFCFGQSLPQRSFEGTIMGKIPITLTLSEDGDAIFGTLIYKKKGIPITVIGSKYDGTYFLKEHMPNGEVTGVFSISPKGTGLEGIWSAPKRDAKELKVSLKQTSRNTVASKPLPDLTGTYYYSFGAEDGSGELKVQQAGPGKLVIALSAVTGGPSFHIADLEKTTISLKGNKAIYENKEFGACKLLFTFGKNSVQIDYLDDAYECGFGARASAAGSYVRIKASKPDFL